MNDNITTDHESLENVADTDAAASSLLRLT